METMDRNAAAMLIAVQGMKVDPFDKESLKKATKLALEVLSELDQEQAYGFEVQARDFFAQQKRVFVDTAGSIRYGDNQAYVWPGTAKLLQYLYANKGRVVSVDEIKAMVIGNSDRTNYAVYTQISSIRNVLGKDGRDIIETQGGRGGGYRWNPAYDLVSE